jgi:hypothetical protein
MSDSCNLCNEHFKELSRNIKEYKDDKSIIVCKCHNIKFDLQILLSHFPGFNKEENPEKSRIPISKFKPKQNIIVKELECILDSNHLAKLVKNVDRFYFKCEEHMNEICLQCGYLLEDQHTCNTGEEDYADYFNNSCFIRCPSCGLYNFPDNSILKCFKCELESCIYCRVPAYLLNCHGKSMHRCEERINSQVDDNYNDNCLTCVKKGESCFDDFFDTDREFIYN